jgi:putative Holliday junction resolvase
MRVLGLDLGEKRIGLAISDAEGRIAFPAGHLDRVGPRKDLEALAALIAERGVERAVVGLPLHLDGRAGREAEAARAFASSLAASAGIPVETLDERWTTVAAHRSLREAGRGTARRRGKGAVDAVAAALLLSTYLDRLHGAAARREGA